MTGKESKKPEVSYFPVPLSLTMILSNASLTIETPPNLEDRSKSEFHASYRLDRCYYPNLSEICTYLR